MGKRKTVVLSEDVWDVAKRRAMDERVTLQAFLERAVCVYIARHPVSEAGLEAALAKSEGPRGKYPPLSKPRPVQWTEIEIEARRAAGLPELTYEPESEV